MEETEMKKKEFKGFNWETCCWASRYYAKLYNPNCVIVKVEGGFVPMEHREYRIWRSQNES